MTEGGDWDPGPWEGHDFGYDSSRDYDSTAGRGYTAAVSAGKVARDLVPMSLTTTSKSPFVLAMDITGSMKKSPGIVFGKVPYLDIEIKEYLGDDTEISFAVFGDGYGSNADLYPLQPRPFSKGTDLRAQLDAFVRNSDGGGQLTENSELAALYYARNVSMPNAVRPIFILYTDEGPYDSTDVKTADRLAHVKLDKAISTKQVFKELMQKFSVYIILKPYSKDAEDCHEGDEMSAQEKEIYAKWVSLVGADRIVLLPDANRIMDSIFGVLGHETGKFDYFREEIEHRQTPQQVKTVYRSLATIHRIDEEEEPKKPKKKPKGPSGSGKSMLHSNDGSDDVEAEPLL